MLVDVYSIVNSFGTKIHPAMTADIRALINTAAAARSLMILIL